MTRARIEGAMLNVCSSCVSFGTEVKIEEKRTIPTVKTKEIPEDTINPDFATLIRQAREAKRLSMEQLASRINEKVSVIERIERDMKPDERLRRKVENTLDIDLSYEEEPVKMQSKITEDYTLGDAVQIRVRKKKN